MYSWTKRIEALLRSQSIRVRLKLYRLNRSLEPNRDIHEAHFWVPSLIDGALFRYYDGAFLSIRGYDAVW